MIVRMARWATVAAMMVSGGASAAARTETAAAHLARNGAATQMMVDGAPYIALAGELHNSSASSPSYMAPVWDRLARNHLNTVIGTASWELVEPEEGRFDFAAVDDQIRQARAHGLRLVLIWFGAYKNAEARYAPSWVRRDEVRFPRAVRNPGVVRTPPQFAHFFTGPALSVFGEPLVQADARAFAALMRHLRDVDHEHIVIMIQVENETGLLGETRDRSALADAAWRQQVPAALTTYLRDHQAWLNPFVGQAWTRQGNRPNGTWAQVFGNDAAAEEIFMAWAFGRYVDRVTRAGAAEYALPMYANAWQGPQPTGPIAGMFPTGGPVIRMLDVWKAAATSVPMLSPDVYVQDFAGTLAGYDRPDNPLFIPETRLDVGNLFVALGEHRAIGFSPFGIDDAPNDSAVFAAYAMLSPMLPLIAQTQADGRIRGVKLAGGGAHHLQLGGYDIAVDRPIDTTNAMGAGTGAAPPPGEGHALILWLGRDDFLVVGRGVEVTFGRSDGEVEVDTADEGRYTATGWSQGRRLNGDERSLLFPVGALQMVRIRLLRRPVQH